MRFYITTPIYYVNDRPHIGHAYNIVAADILARYNRFLGNDVFFLAGTDEHGVKIEEASQKENIEPQKFCDEKVKMFQESWQKLDISYDNFIRTTDNEHIKAAQFALRELYEKQFIYKGFYEGLYCKGCEQYKTKTDLVGGKCPDHQKEPILMKEESYFFKMSQFQNDLKNKIKNGELKIEPDSKRNEVLGFLESQPLEDISISRKNIKWGIPLPFDQSYTCYVWVEAFLNYLTGLGWKGPGVLQTENFAKYWPANIQLIGKDILRVHATIWPALLLALNLPLPKKIFAHGYFTINGKKMSKSLGNVIWPEDLISKYGTDATRYLLISLVPFGNDGDISLAQIEEKYNADLVNGIGNVVSRFIGIMVKNPPANNLEINFARHWEKISKNDFDFNFADVKYLLSAIDRRINDGRLWQEPEKKKADFITIAEELSFIAASIKAVMPATSNTIFDCLGVSEFNSKTWPEIKKEIQKQPVRKLKIKPLEKHLFPRLK